MIYRILIFQLKLIFHLARCVGTSNDIGRKLLYIFIFRYRPRSRATPTASGLLRPPPDSSARNDQNRSYNKYVGRVPGQQKGFSEQTGIATSAVRGVLAAGGSQKSFINRGPPPVRPH